MPIYEVKDPSTGQILELEGDSPPTEQELDQIFSSIQNPGSLVDAVIEPIEAIGGNIVSTAASGLAGLGTLAATGGNVDKSVQVINNTKERFPDFSPQTTAGQKSLKTVGDLIEAGVDLVNYPISGLAGLGNLLATGDLQSAARMVKDVQAQGLGETLADRTMEATNSPLAATAAYIAPDLAGMATGAMGAKTAAKATGETISRNLPVRRASRELVLADGSPSPAFQKALKAQGATFGEVIDDVPRIADGTNPKKAVNEIIKRKIRAGDTDNFLATKRIDASGRVVDDELGAEAVKQGFRGGDVQNVKTSGPGTRRGMQEMLGVKRRIYKNERLAADMRPSDTIGRSAMERVKHIRSTASSARTELDNIAKTKLSGVEVDVDSVAENFMREMERLDVTMDVSRLPPTPDFAGSMIAKDRTSQKVIKDVISLLAEPKAPDALRMHKLKRQLDAMIDFRKSSQGGLTEAGRNVAKSVRASLNKAIRDVDDDYARVNDTLSTSLDAMDSLDKAVGPSINLWSEGAEKALGQDLRSILSKNKSRVRLENALNDLDDTARDLGGVFDDDIKSLIVFEKMLDDQFGDTARRGFAAETESATKRAMRGKDGIKDWVYEKAAEKIDEARDINDEAAFRVLDKIIKREMP